MLLKQDIWVTARSSLRFKLGRHRVTNLQFEAWIKHTHSHTTPHHTNALSRFSHTLPRRTPRRTVLAVRPNLLGTTVCYTVTKPTAFAEESFTTPTPWALPHHPRACHPVPVGTLI
jgi:hypothetical protein